jgi:hypothetical protein
MKIFSAQLKGTTIVVEGATASITGSFTGSIAGIDINATNQFTASTIARLNSIETISSSNDSRVNSLEAFSSSIFTTNTFTSSTSARLNSIETTSASNIARLTSLEIKTGSLATTGSNTFIGTQTITGSLFISSDLIVQGSSSLQNITASAVSIGTNIVNLNTANPAIRYAGLSIGDSGSIGSSGSFLYDSVQDEMIFIHRGANSTVTSSVTLMGPQTYDSIGNEIYPTNNIIQKGTGNEHLVDSCIFDNGTTTCVKNNFISTGTGLFNNILRVDSSSTSTLRLKGNSVTGTDLQNDSGGGYIWNRDNTPLYFATNNTQRLIIAETGPATFSCSLTANGDISIVKASAASIFLNNTTINGKNFRLVSADDSTFRVQHSGIADLLTIASTGAATFIGDLQVGGIYRDFAGEALLNTNTNCITMLGTSGAVAPGRALSFFAGNNSRLCISTTGISTFTCQICARALVIGADCSGVLVDVAGRHGLMKYTNFSTGLIGACSGTDSNISTWMGRFAGTILAPTAVYQDLVINGSGNIGMGNINPASRLTISPPSCVNASSIEFTNSDNAVISSHFSLTLAVNNSNTQSGRAIVFSGGGKGYGNQTSNIATFTSDDRVANFFGAVCTPVIQIGSSCSPSAGINFLGREGYREKWLITQGRYRFCFGTEDFYAAIFIEMYGTNYNQGTSEVRVAKAVIPLRYGFSKSISQIYSVGGVCVGAYVSNGIGLAWCNINSSVSDLIYTNAGSNSADSVLATELQLLSNGFSLTGRFYRMCHTNTLYDTVNPYV